MDVGTLTDDLGNAYSQATGFPASTMNPAWVQGFISRFTTEELQETALAKQGKPYYVPDPVSEANAYVASTPS